MTTGTLIAIVAVGVIVGMCLMPIVSAILVWSLALIIWVVVFTFGMINAVLTRLLGRGRR